MAGEKPAERTPARVRTTFCKESQNYLMVLLPLWRRERDSNPRGDFSPTHFPGVPVQPLLHLSLLAGCDLTSQNHSLSNFSQFASCSLQFFKQQAWFEELALLAQNKCILLNYILQSDCRVLFRESSLEF